MLRTGTFWANVFSQVLAFTSRREALFGKLARRVRTRQGARDVPGPQELQGGSIARNVNLAGKT